MTHIRTMVLGLIVAMCILTETYAFASDLILTNARIIDGTGSPPRERQSIKIISGRISEIAEHIDSRGVPTVDVHGSSVLPGFIDAHVHLKTLPGTAFRQDDEATFNQQFEQQMRAYLGSGVTSVLDAASPEDILLRVKHYQNSGGAGPTVYFLAPFLTPDAGYFGSEELRDNAYKSMWKTIDSKESVVASFDKARPLRAIGAKATVEYGFGPFRVWPVFSKDMRQFLKAQAASQDVPLFIHSFSEEEHRLALEMNPRALMHAGFPGEKPSDEIMNTMKKQNVFVVSTQTIYDMSLLEWQLSRLDEPAYKLLVPKVQLQTARNPHAWSFAREKITKISAPTWIPEFLVRAFGELFYNEEVVRSQLKSSATAIKMMFERGIPIVMGSDSGCWPALPGVFHGVSSIREIELLGAAGLPASAVIMAATKTAAEMMGIDREVGTIEVGKQADLIVVRGDPLSDLTLLRSIEWTVKAGVMRTPKEWMALTHGASQ